MKIDATVGYVNQLIVMLNTAQKLRPGELLRVTLQGRELWVGPEDSDGTVCPLLVIEFD